MTKDRFGGNRLFFDLPTIVIGNHRHARERDLRFACELRFRKICHSDDVETIATVEFRFRSRRKRRPVHVHIGATVVNLHFQFSRCFGKQVAQTRADWFGETDVRNNAFAEKCVCAALARPIVKLRRQENITRRIFFLQAANGRDANNPANVKRAQRINIRAMIQLVRQNPMTASVSWQKINLPPG